MIGRDYYRIETECELSDERFKSLVFFYGPLIGNDAMSLYLNLVYRQNSFAFNELNELLSFLNISVTDFEQRIDVLNQYELVRTLNLDNKFIFIINSPLGRKQFIDNDVFVRELILKTSGAHYQSLISDIRSTEYQRGFNDVSHKLPNNVLDSWSKDDETYLNKKKNDTYTFNTLFDVNVFLKDISTNLLPMRFRTRENLEEMAKLADLYSISYDKMRTFLPKVANTETDQFDLSTLKYLCMKAKIDYEKSDSSDYAIPSQKYLMSLQDGKEVTDYDKKILYKLSNDYHLSIPVINVLLEYTLKNCDNRLIENYIYPIASDMHRNDIATAKDALERLYRDNKSSNKQTSEPIVYDTSKNKKLSEEQLEELLSLRNKNE